MRTLVAAGIVVSALACLSLGCEEAKKYGHGADTTQPPGNVDTTTPPPVDAVSPGDGVDTVPIDAPVVMGPFKAQLQDFQTKDPVEGADIEVYDNATGKPTGQKTKSGADGAVEFELAKGQKVGFRAVKEGSEPTYQFNIDSDAQAETLWLVSHNTYMVAPTLAGLTLDTSKGLVAGGLYFVNDKAEEEFVGCATIDSDPAGEYRYFSPTTGLPTNLTYGPTTSPKISYFLAANIDLKGEDMAVTKVMAHIPGAGVDPVGEVSIYTYKGGVCISNIYVTTKKNPTPGDCQ